MELTNQRKGVLRRWAREFGLSLDEYFFLCETQKRCQKCKKWKSKKEFPSDKSRKDGLNVKCHSCIRVKVKKPPITSIEARKAAADRCRNKPPSKGRKLTKEHKQRLRECRINEGIAGNGSFYGKNNPNWKGGISPEIKTARTIFQYREWRTKVFERDNYSCVRCGDDRGGNLHAHHIKKFSDFPELRYEVSNGETLCFDCHAKEHDVPNSFRKRRYARRKKVV